jgi:hypothetical protein
MRIGVCIPVVSRHLPLLATCLESLERQTRKPDVVSIRVSEASAVPIIIPCSFPVVLQHTPEKSFAGANRNGAAYVIQDRVDLLSFIDADDFMHPQCLEQTERHFRQDIEVLVHGFLDCKNAPERALYEARALNRIPWTPIGSTLQTDGFSTSKDAYQPIHRLLRLDGQWFHNAHLTCRTSVWIARRWPEEFGLIEDTIYNYQLYTRGYKYGFTADKLTYYM